MTRLLVPLATVLAFVACGGSDSQAIPTPRASSTVSIAATTAATSVPVVSVTGVTGLALVGPTCPVQRLDDACPDRPWQGIIVARSLSGSDAGRAMTDAEGRFTIQLVPGTYLVVTLTSGILPAPASAQITVVAGQMTQVELVLDSGIR